MQLSGEETVIINMTGWGEGVNVDVLQHTSLLERCMNTSRTSTPPSTVVIVSKADDMLFCIITSKSFIPARNLHIRYNVCNLYRKCACMCYSHDSTCIDIRVHDTSHDVK